MADKDPPWTEAELAASVDAYAEMLALTKAGTKFVKRQIITKLTEGPLSRRSRGSVEFRFQNISDILYQHGNEWIKGYPPHANTGSNRAAVLIRLLNEKGILSDPRQPTNDQRVLEARVDAIRAAPEDYLKRKPMGSKAPQQVATVVMQHIRDPQVKAWVLNRAQGICEACEAPAPFVAKKDKLPFLEVHHVIPLAEGGPDTVENAAAVCPNCHRRLHLGVDKDAYRKLLSNRLQQKLGPAASSPQPGKAIA